MPKGAEAAAAGAKGDLIEHVRPPPEPLPEAVEPTEWVYTWLKGHGLHALAPKLIDANFVEKADLLLEPRLSLVDVEKLGVEKACDVRKIFNLAKAL